MNRIEHLLRESPPTEAQDAGPGGTSRGQRFFLSDRGARAYAAVREGWWASLFTGKTFSREIDDLVAGLKLPKRNGDKITLLDVPCGQGNFTAAIARRVPSGLVVGLDLSGAMLALARKRVEREGLGNVELVRGSAMELPFRDGVFDAISNCGGLHLYPDPLQAIREMRRVLKPGGAIAGLTVRLHPGALSRIEARVHEKIGTRGFDFDELGRQFEREGFTGFRYTGTRLISWFNAERSKQ